MRKCRLCDIIATGPLGENLLALTAIIVGVALLMPQDTFSRPAFAALSETASESLWGFVMIASGAAQVAACYRGNTWWRVATSVFAGAIWSIWLGAMVISAWAGIVWAFNLALLIGHTVLILRLLSER